MATTHISPSHRSGSCCCRIFALVLALLCIVGIPATWLLLEQSCVVSGAIRVAPVVSNIITGQKDGRDISDYTSFVTTQAMMITSPQVVREVANDLSGKELQFFEERTNTFAAKIARKFGAKEITADPEKGLKQAILDEIITARPAPRSETILVSMEWHNTDEAKRIVDSFIRNYMSLVVVSASDKEEEQLATLQNEQKLLYSKLEDDRAQIRGMAAEYGSKKLGHRYDMNLKRVGMLLDTLTEVEARRIYLETQVSLAAQTGPNTPMEDPVDSKARAIEREEYVNRDAMVIALANNVVALERELIEDTQTLPPGDEKIKQKREVLETLRKRLEDHKEIGRVAFNELMEHEAANASSKELDDLKKALEQTQAHEDKIRSLLAKEDRQSIDLGHKNLAIEALQDELVLTKEMYDAISRRIQQFKMERKRPARISVAHAADVDKIRDIRGRCTIALAIGFVVFGTLSLLLRRRRPRLPAQPQP
ncbi:MAG: GumC domain-containing protein [Planctomycetota bacterium]|jgi:hypothetical protein